MPHWSVVEMTVLGCIVGAFVTFGVTLFAIAMSASLASDRKQGALSVAVTPSRSAHREPSERA
jgi:hypothetical protein